MIQAAFSTRVFIVAWEWRQSEETPQQLVCYRAWDDNKGLDTQEQRDIGNLKLFYLFSCQAWKFLLKLGDWITG